MKNIIIYIEIWYINKLKISICANTLSIYHKFHSIFQSRYSIKFITYLGSYCNFNNLKKNRKEAFTKIFPITGFKISVLRFPVCYDIFYNEFKLLIVRACNEKFLAPFIYLKWTFNVSLGLCFCALECFLKGEETWEIMKTPSTLLWY